MIRRGPTAFPSKEDARKKQKDQKLALQTDKKKFETAPEEPKQDEERLYIFPIEL